MAFFLTILMRARLARPVMILSLWFMMRQFVLLYTCLGPSSYRKPVFCVKNSSWSRVLSILQNTVFKYIWYILIFKESYLKKKTKPKPNNSKITLEWSLCCIYHCIRIQIQIMTESDCFAAMIFQKTSLQKKTKPDIIMPSTPFIIKIKTCIYEVMNLFLTRIKYI